MVQVIRSYPTEQFLAGSTCRYRVIARNPRTTPAASRKVAVRATDLPVTISYKQRGGTAKTEKFSKLIIAVDPRALISTDVGKKDVHRLLDSTKELIAYEDSSPTEPQPSVLKDATNEEIEVASKLTSFTFHTQLVEATRNPLRKWCMSLDKENMENQDGRVYAMRDEHRAHHGPGNDTESELQYFATYQILARSKARVAQEEFEEKWEDDLEKGATDWIQISNPEIKRSNTVDYFPHFEQRDLDSGLPWKVLGMQGKNNTLWVSSFTIFESALHIINYAHMLKNSKMLQGMLPADKDAPIAVIGGGPSGIFWGGHMLKRLLGYTNVKVFEKTERYGGKTRTIKHQTDKLGPLVCELGTCYLSNDYVPVDELLEEYGLEKKYPLGVEFGDDDFRGITNVKIGKDGQPLSDAEMFQGIPFDDWVQGQIKGKDIVDLVKSTIAIKRYMRIHREIFGENVPMPLEQPKEWDARLKKTFQQFLQDEGCADLIPPFLYGYEVQGYGDLEKIPAWYGLVWLTPRALEPSLPVFKWAWPPIGFRPGVFALREGWLQLWDKIKEENDVEVLLNVNVESIERK